MVNIDFIESQMKFVAILTHMQLQADLSLLELNRVVVYSGGKYIFENLMEM